jgi:hypothetical protein
MSALFVSFFAANAGADEKTDKKASESIAELEKKIKAQSNGTSKESESTIDMVMDRARLLMDKLEKRERKVDPFGMSMDPENQVVVAEEVEEAAPRQVTTLEEAVARFRVSGVIPKRNEVIVGARSLGLGDRILIEHKEVRFDLTIVEVTALHVSLKDTETGEIASVDLGIVPDTLPVGLGPQGPGITANGGIQSMNSAYQVE